VVTVFRVENEDGTGPYRTGFSELCDAHRNAGHPPPDLDPAPVDGMYETTRAYSSDPTSSKVLYDVERYRVLDINPDEVCALPTVERLAEWFEGFGERLDARGYSVVEYDVPPEHVRHGKHQTVFRKGFALKIKRYSATELIGA